MGDFELDSVMLISPEPIRERVQGIGIRFLEMAEVLRRRGFRVTLWVPNEDIPPDKRPWTAPVWGPAFSRYLERARVVVVHGHISEHYFSVLTRENPQKRPPLVVDLYDPFLVENLQYTPFLGDHIFYRDRSVLFRQLLYGDFFLTASEAQRLFFIGVMMGMGRIRPRDYHQDPTLRSWIDVAPFGTRPMELDRIHALAGKIKGVIPGIGCEDIVVFFGGIYEWYDPLLLLEGSEAFVEEGWPLRILFCTHPSPETTPQKKLAQVRQWSDARQWTGRYVFFIPWFPYEERFQYYKDVDIAVSLHRPSLEADLSFRTRILDFLNAALPVVVTDGGEGSQKVREAGCGVVVRPHNREDLQSALRFYLEHPQERHTHGELGRQWVQSHLEWSRALQPLVTFCAAPQKKPAYLTACEGAEVKRVFRDSLRTLFLGGGASGHVPSKGASRCGAGFCARPEGPSWEELTPGASHGEPEDPLWPLSEMHMGLSHLMKKAWRHYRLYGLRASCQRAYRIWRTRM